MLNVHIELPSGQCVDTHAYGLASYRHEELLRFCLAMGLHCPTAATHEGLRMVLHKAGCYYVADLALLVPKGQPKPYVLLDAGLGVIRMLES